MAKIVTCEGKCEMYLIDRLIDSGQFFLKRDELLDNRIFHIRQLKSIKSIINSLPIEEEIDVYRIGDTQNDEYDLSPFKLRQHHIHIFRICTKPEIEILIIIGEGKINDYWKSGLSPKAYVKTYLLDCLGFKEYVDSHDIVKSIKEYKRIKKHEKDELYLMDYIEE